MSKIFTALIVVLTVFSITNVPLLSVTWKFTPRAEIDNNWFKETSKLGNLPILKLMGDRGEGYSFELYNKSGFNKISFPEIEKKVDPLSQMFSFENQLFVATGKNSILKLDENYNWEVLELDDKYNQQNNEFMRVTKKVVDYNDKLYCLAEAWDVKSIDTVNGVVSTLIDTKYMELISIEDDILKKEFSENIGDVGRFFELAADSKSLWISSSNLIRYEDGEIKEEIDIYNTLDFDPNIILSDLVVDKDYVYMLKQLTSAGTKNTGTYLIKYEKSTGNLEKYEFPSLKSYADSETLIKPSGFNNMIIENDKIYISSQVGLYEFSNNELKYVDIFSEFLDEIPTVFHPYLISENVSIVENTIYISTNVGLIYSDDFTSTTGINISITNVDLDIYPNVVTNGQNSLTVESTESKNINIIMLYNLEGTAIYEFDNTPQQLIGSIVLDVPNLPSGSYFITVKADKDNYISPLIIQN